MKKYFKETVIPALIWGTMVVIVFSITDSLSISGIICAYLLFLIPMTIDDWWTVWRGDNSTTNSTTITTTTANTTVIPSNENTEIVNSSHSINDIYADEFKSISFKIRSDIQKNKTKTIRNSNEFKSRINSIIPLIEEESSKGNYEVVISSWKKTETTDIEPEVKTYFLERGFGFSRCDYERIKITWFR